MSAEHEPLPVCVHCQTGHLRRRRLTLARWVGGRFIIVPNFPAWLCDVCGAREYDSEALDFLQTVLAAQPELRRRRRDTHRDVPAAATLQRLPGRYRV